MDFNYVLVDEEYFRKFRPQMADLLGSETVGSFRFVKTFAKPSGGRIIIYSIKSANQF
jgi:hypothetical protein